MDNKATTSQRFEVIFDADTRAHLEKIDRAMEEAVRNAMIEAGNPFVAKKQAIYELIYSKEKLDGAFDALPDNKGLYRKDAIPPQPDFTKVTTIAKPRKRGK